MKIVQQRAEQDCGVAALAALAEQSYEDAYLAVSKVDPQFNGKSGLDNKQIIAAAKVLGLTLLATRTYDLDDDEGVLRIRWNPLAGRNMKAREITGGHFVAVAHGVIVCSSYKEVQPWRTYLERNAGRACTLLKVVA